MAKNGTPYVCLSRPFSETIIWILIGTEIQFSNFFSTNPYVCDVIENNVKKKYIYFSNSLECNLKWVGIGFLNIT